MNLILKKYATLLVEYCLDVQANEKVYVKSSSLAEELLKYVHDAILMRGGHPYINMSIKGTDVSFYDHANEHQLNHINQFSELALNEFDSYLVIRAPHNLREASKIDNEKRKIRTLATKALNDVYFERTANGEMKRSLCQFPTNASAQEAGMSLEGYSRFVFDACGLFEENPESLWLKVREDQQKLVDYLHTKDKIRYVTRDTDITYHTKGRTWINSDGRTNMPSGEVFTAPIEDSVNGQIVFSYPSIYRGQSVEKVKLTVKDGQIIDWDAKQGKELLDEVFQIEGTRVFGEAAIGTNYRIQQVTKNILFDEKIGGSIHMAIGQAYKQCGGLNKSPIHWDMITDMKDGGQIFADGELFYENGKVILW